MSYSLKGLPFRLDGKLPKKLSASFDRDKRVQHTKDWLPLEGYGIQPCGDGIQVYAQPQTPDEIKRLANALHMVARKLETK